MYIISLNNKVSNSKNNKNKWAKKISNKSRWFCVFSLFFHVLMFLLAALWTHIELLEFWTILHFVENLLKFIVGEFVFWNLVFFVPRPVEWWREKGVQSYPYSILYHVRNNLSTDRGTCSYIWIHIDFDEPRLKVLVDHKIEAKNLKNVLFSFRIKLKKGRMYRVSRYSLHLWIYVFH